MTAQPFSIQIENSVRECLVPQIVSQHKMLLAVSGGADSTALARVIHQVVGTTNQNRIAIAHVNHQLRDEDSEQDQRFVESLASQLGFPFYCAQLPPPPTSNGLEADLRELRYNYLTDLAGQIGARYLLTGHHRNDQTETVLFRLIRGTGINGLAGIPRMRNHNEHLTIIRPLLSVARETIVGYLEELEQSFRSDSSNRESTFSRNKIRNHILPTINEAFDWDVNLNFERLTKQANEWVDFLNSMAYPILESHCTIETNRVTFPLSNLIDLHPVLLRQVMTLLWQKMDWPLQAMSRDKWLEIQDSIFSSDPARGQQKRQHLKKILPGKIELLISENALKLSRIVDS